jgi:hypothetical protein
MGLPKGDVPADRFLYGWNKNIKTHKEIHEPIWEEILKVALSKLK